MHRSTLVAFGVAALGLAQGCASHTASVAPVSEADPALTELPKPESYKLGPGDHIAIRVWRQDDLTMDVYIAPDGTITYPLIGRIQAAGLTYPDLIAALTKAISTYYEAPQVTVNVLDVQNQKVMVVGEVTTPSVLQLTSEMTILEALTLAGGLNQYARTSNVLLIRGGIDKPALYTVDVHALITEGKMDQLVYLQRGDIVVVPTRTITSAARYFRDVQTILAPFVAGSAVYRNALGGGAQGTSSVLE